MGWLEKRTKEVLMAENSPFGLLRGKVDVLEIKPYLSDGVEARVPLSHHPRSSTKPALANKCMPNFLNKVKEATKPIGVFISSYDCLCTNQALLLNNFAIHLPNGSLIIFAIRIYTHYNTSTFSKEAFVALLCTRIADQTGPAPLTQPDRNFILLVQEEDYRRFVKAGSNIGLNRTTGVGSSRDPLRAIVLDHVALETGETAPKRTLANQAQKDVTRGAEVFKTHKMKEAKLSDVPEVAEAAKGAWKQRKNVAKANKNYALMVIKAARAAVKSGEATPAQGHKIKVKRDHNKKRLAEWQEAAVCVPKLESIRNDKQVNWTKELANKLATKKRKLDQRKAGLATGYADSNKKKDAKKREELKQKGGNVHWRSRLAADGTQAVAAHADFEAHPERAANVKPFMRLARCSGNRTMNSAATPTVDPFNCCRRNYA